MSSNEDPRLSGPLANLRDQGDGFRTPSTTYFDELAERAIQEAGQKNATVTRRLYQPWMSIAASLLVLLVAGFLLWPTDNDQSTTENGQLLTDNRQPTTDEILADIDPADIEAYITSDLDNFETELYADNADNDYLYE